MNTLDSLNEVQYYSTESLRINGDVRMRRLLTVSGDLTIDGDAVIEQSLFVRGDLSITGSLAVGILIVDGAVKIEGTLRASGFIIAGKDIVAETIEATRIETGGKLSADWVFASEFEVVCKQLETKTLPLGRNYWANHPALAEWKEFLSDENHCWADFKTLAKKTGNGKLDAIDFGHWTLNAQFRNFVGLEPNIPELEFKGVPKTINEDVDLEAEPGDPLDNIDVPNYIYDIIEDKKKTPYPNYSKNASYQKICKKWGSDIRESYHNINVDMDSLKTCVKSVEVEDESVKKQLLENEIPAVQNVRKLIDNHHHFIQDSFFDKGTRLQTVKDTAQVSDNSSTTLNILKLYTTIIGTICGPAGAIGSIMLSTVTLLKDAKGSIDPISGKLSEYQAKLTERFEELLAENATIEQKLISDYGKLLKVDELIRTGKLSWTESEYANAVRLAGLVYERKLWVAILPICWWPTFSYFCFDNQKNKNCGNVVYMPYWTECKWGHIGRNGPYIPYWLVCGGGVWWSHEVGGVAKRLSEIGVSMGSIMRGEGDWGPAFAEYRKHPVGFQQTPGCVKSSPISQ